MLRHELMDSFPSSAQKVREMEDVVQQCAENVSPTTAIPSFLALIDYTPNQLVSAMRGYVNSQIETGTTSPVVNISEWNSSVAYAPISSFMSCQLTYHFEKT